MICLNKNNVIHLKQKVKRYCAESSGKVINFWSVKTSIWQTPRCLRGSTFSAQTQVAAALHSATDARRRRPPLTLTSGHFLSLLDSTLHYLFNQNKLCKVSSNRQFRKLPGSVVGRCPLEISQCFLKQLYCDRGSLKCIYNVYCLPSCDNDQDV
jgi:hypothetical protein